ncbi:MAG TPA: circularly permuted type 2 ATP-grasp protein [Verrucomicrobiae bacterium]|nr:circularly permuted type 2 ATP-grasp protein [Verrucomicrobiae bacterium]
MSDADNTKKNPGKPQMFQSQSMTSETGAAKRAATGLGGLLENYPRGYSAFDELLDKDGQLRPHYAKWFGGLESLNSVELARRSDLAKLLVQEQGITYHVYSDPRGMERPWQLDVIPFILAPQEWRALEAGLIQRATLLNKILADCYGAQELIRSRWLSPALVFAQPDFLRPCHSTRSAQGTMLHFYAADLGRSLDGRWWVISDRTQIPTGAGYTLANRLITSRVLPESFRDNRIHRLAGFFRTVQTALAQITPRKAENPRIVMLTPGPHNETYFEQTYLARYLGYMLVEGQDLTVRDNYVFLKTLSGLERVDVILRRVDDDFCDPLELRNDSMLGVPGLVEAIRAGNVTVANALGSGLAQSPALMPFLPGLCQHLLGEELKLPSVATWWCGQKTAQRHVLENLDKLVVKPAFRPHGQNVGSEKPPNEYEQDTLRRRIEFDPDLFVAQERVELSTAPCWDGTAIVAQPVSLRVYLVAKDDGYRVMPGGLARVFPGNEGHSISLQRGGSSKDTWVVSETPVEEVTLLDAPAQTIELRRTGNNLPSRLADNFFWLGRYSERADATARLLRSTLQRFSPEGTSGAMPVLAPLLQSLHVQGQLPGILEKPELRQNPETFEAELLAAIFDPARNGSVRHSIDHLHRLAMLVRDRTSHDMWRVLNQLYERLASPTSSLVMLGGDATSVLSQALIGLAAFHGLARENMTRAQAWRFLDMGMRLERAVYLCTLLDATLHSPDAENPSVLEAVLEVADSTITFRSRYNLLAHAPAAFDLVLLDDKNPRSVLFQIFQLTQHFEHLPREREASGSGKNILRDCFERLNRTDARELATPRERWAESNVRRVIKETLRDLPKLSDVIAANYFAHSEISRTGGGDIR